MEDRTSAYADLVTELGIDGVASTAFFGVYDGEFSDFHGGY